MQVEFDLYSLGSTKFWLLNQTQSRKTYVCSYHLSYIDLCKNDGAGWKANTLPIELHARSPRWGSPAEVVSCCKLHSWADVPLVLLVKKPMDLMGQSFSQLHFTFQMETRSCFLGVS